MQCGLDCFAILALMHVLRFGQWFRSAALVLCVSAQCAIGAHAQAFAVTLSPALVEAGSPELISVAAPAGATLEGEWLGQKLAFFRGRDGQTWYALAGVDVEAPTGLSVVHITARLAGGVTPNLSQSDLSRSIEIHEAHYGASKLTVAPKFVAPGAKELTRIKAEMARKEKVFAASAPQPLWSGDFRAPVHAQPTDSFGTRRTFNGQLESVHKGMDFRAPPGRLVRAGNSGVVVLARRLYFEGNCVIIDHGLGLFTLSMHLSRIDVHEGQQVTKGQRVGLSGATGRVTGPHLHWAVRWQNAYLDPAKLLQMDLNGVR
jgi:murein DD-endopeptidase MepM/ murein hydrolase activator NlpD